MKARRGESRRSGCLKVVPRPRGGWVVVNHRGAVVSEHPSATEAELAAAALEGPSARSCVLRSATATHGPTAVGLPADSPGGTIFTVRL